MATEYMTHNDQTIVGSKDTIIVYPKITGSVTGSYDTIKLDGQDDLTVSGGADTVIGSGDTIHLHGGFTVNGGSDTIDMWTGAASVSIVGGSGDVVYASDDTINVASGLSFTLCGTGDAVYASGATIYTSPNTSFSLYGNDDAIYLAAGNTVALEGGYGNVGTPAAIRSTRLQTPALPFSAATTR